METKQYTLIERNRHERETFNSIMDLTEEQAKYIEDWIINYGDETPAKYSLEKTSYTVGEVAELNTKSTNSYMEEFLFCNFPTQDRIDVWTKINAEEQIFYKRGELID